MNSRNMINSNSKSKYAAVALYVMVLAFIVFVCYALFDKMAVNLDGNYKSDIPYYIKRSGEADSGAYRLVFVIFRFLHGLTGTIQPIVIFLAFEIALIMLANLAFIRYFARFDFSKTQNLLAAELFSVATVFMGPIYVPSIHHYFFKNTFPTFAWHSPTQQMMMLFAITGTLCLFKMLDGYEEKIDKRMWIGTSVLLLFSAYAKPSYIIDLVPALIVTFVIELFRKGNLEFWERFKRLFIMGMSLVPSGIYMIALHYHIYVRAERKGDSEILISSEKLAGYNHIVIAICCSLAFAGIVVLFNIKRIAKDRNYLIILLIAVMGFMQWGLLGESGSRSSHGNFDWGCLAGEYMLVLSCVSVAAQNYRDKEFLGNRKSIRIVYFILLLGTMFMHLVSNIYYFYTMCNGAGFWR